MMSRNRKRTCLVRTQMEGCRKERRVKEGRERGWREEWREGSSRDVHPPKPMMHIAYYPLFSQNL